MIYMNHEYTVYKCIYIFLQGRYTTWWLKSIHNLVFCRKILLHSFLPNAAQVACLEHPGIAPPSADSQMCPSHEVQDEDLGKKAFQWCFLEACCRGEIFLGIWLNIYVIQSLRRKLRRHFQLGKQLFVYTPKACESNLNWEGTLGRFAGALRAPKPVGGFLLLDAPTGLQPRLPVLLLSICDLLDGPAA